MGGGARLSAIARVGGAKNAVLALLAGALACREPVSSAACPLRGRPLHDRRPALCRRGRAHRPRAARARSTPTPASSTRTPRSRTRCGNCARAFFAGGADAARLGSVRMPLPGDAPSAPARWTATSPVRGPRRGRRGHPGRRRDRQGRRAGATRRRRRGGGVRGDAPTRLRGAGAFARAVPSVGATLRGRRRGGAGGRGDGVANAAARPEVVDRAHARRRGRKIAGAGTSEIRVEGVAWLRGCRLRAPSRTDRGGDAPGRRGVHALDRHRTLAPVVPERRRGAARRAPRGGVRRAAADRDKALEEDPGGARRVRDASSEAAAAARRARRAHADAAPGRRALSSFDVSTAPHPGPPTDMQPQLCVLAAVAAGTSTAARRCSSRFSHVRELAKMGVRRDARDPRGDHRSRRGGSRSGPRTCAGAICARRGARPRRPGERRRDARVRDLKHLDRGYERLDEKLAALGAVVRRREWSE